jgi:hypothetical protein
MTDERARSSRRRVVRLHPHRQEEADVAHRRVDAEHAPVEEADLAFVDEQIADVGVAVDQRLWSPIPDRVDVARALGEESCDGEIRLGQPPGMVLDHVSERADGEIDRTGSLLRPPTARSRRAGRRPGIGRAARRAPRSPSPRDRPRWPRSRPRRRSLAPSDPRAAERNRPCRSPRRDGRSASASRAAARDRDRTSLAGPHARRADHRPMLRIRRGQLAEDRLGRASGLVVAKPKPGVQVRPLGPIEKLDRPHAHPRMTPRERPREPFGRQAIDVTGQRVRQTSSSRTGGDRPLRTRRTIPPHGASTRPRTSERVDPPGDARMGCSRSSAR